MSFELLNKELIWACSYGEKFTQAAELLQLGADPNVMDHGDKRFRRERTPLHYGCAFGNLEFVRLLIETYNCDREVRDTDRKAPLHYACQYGHLNIVKYLKEHGCNPEVRDSDQQTPFDLAYQNEHMDVVEFLIRQQDFDPHKTINRDQQTLLHCVCRDGHYNIVQYLITKHDCNIEAKDKLGCTSLHTACISNRSIVIKLLLANGKCNTDQTNLEGDTALHIACRSNYVDVAKVLISEGKCNPDLTNNNGDSSLHIACKENHSDLVKVLIREGKCNTDLANKNGDTALHLACKKTVCTSILKYLLSEGSCNPNLKNDSGLVPLELTSDNSLKFRELIRYGANPSKVNTHDKVVKIKQPLQSLVKVFVVGNVSAGKSTLIAALKREKSAIGSWRKVSGVGERTAGVIPHEFDSKKYGCITIYDFSGQPEFYSSHAALLQNAIQTSPPIFLVVVDLQKSNEEIKRTILYWLSFLANQCTSLSCKPHVIIVGSHADVLRARGEDPKLKSSIFLSLQSSHQFKDLQFIVLDCQYSESKGMSELRQSLKKSCDCLRNQDTININAHCLFVYLCDNFRDSAAITIKDIVPHIRRRKQTSNESELSFFLPINVSALCSLCDELNDRGHILFLKDSSSIINSWIIIDKAALLSNIIGTIFAPVTFKQHRKLSSITGVVPVSTLEKVFPQCNLKMTVVILTHLEFCHEISDQEVLKLVTKRHHTGSAEVICLPSDRYLIFPGLNSVDIPSEVWDSNPEFHYHCGWTLQCTQPEQFFTSRFLQVLLLRLMFICVFTHDNQAALLRKCSLWKNGIYWRDRHGVETLVEVVEQNKAIIVLMRCPKLTSEYLQLLSSVIQKVLVAASEFCNKADTMESFIDPSEIIKYPLKPTSQLTLFSLTEIAEAVINGKPAVVSASGKLVSVCKLGIRFDQDVWSIFAGRRPKDLIKIDATYTHWTRQLSSEQLSLSGLHKVRKAIWNSRVKWYDLGIELGISVDTLKVIKTNNHHEVDNCFTAMLEEWLKTNPTWSGLVEALNSSPVDYPQIAEEIRTTCYVNTTFKKYIAVRA